MNMNKQPIKPIANETIRSILIYNGDLTNSVQIGLQSSVPFSSLKRKKPSEHSRLLFNEVWFTWLPVVELPTVVSRCIVSPKSDVVFVLLSISNWRKL